MIGPKSLRCLGMLVALLIAPNAMAGETPALDAPSRLALPVAARDPADPAANALRAFADESVSAAGSTSIDVWLESQHGLSEVVVRPGGTVEYRIYGLLSDDANEGLALIGLSLAFEGGDLDHADTPTGDPESGCENPMIHFTKPWGITNPAGYGGTIINGQLIQIGGGQNSINNPPDNAEFPIGTVLTGVARPAGCGEALIVTGRLTAPQEEGTYLLEIFDVFANVIIEGETGDPFWATQAATVGEIGNLLVIVDDRKPTRIRDPKAAFRQPTNIRE